MNAEKKAQIEAAKGPVQEWLNTRDRLARELEEYTSSGKEVVDHLLKVAGANGPFRFEQGRITFRRTRSSDGAFLPYAESDRSEL